MEGHLKGSSQCKARWSAPVVGAIRAVPLGAGRGSKKVKDVEEESNADARSDSAASLSTAASAQVATEEREIRRLEKRLREISKLEERLAAGGNLDALQRAKIEQRHEVEIDLDSARGLAQARARGAAASAR